MLGAPPCATSRFFLCCPWEDPKVDSTTPVVRIIETLCGASSYAARFWCM